MSFTIAIVSAAVNSLFILFFLSEQTCFPVDPAGLSGFSYRISHFFMAYEEGRQGIMGLPVFQNFFSVIIRITIAAEMGTGIIGSYVMSKQASATWPDFFSGCRHYEWYA